MEYEIWKGEKDKKWYWHLLDPDNDDIANPNIARSSGGFDDRKDCVTELLLTRGSRKTPIYRKWKSKGGKWIRRLITPKS